MVERARRHDGRAMRHAVEAGGGAADVVELDHAAADVCER